MRPCEASTQYKHMNALVHRSWILPTPHGKKERHRAGAFSHRALGTMHSPTKLMRTAVITTVLLCTSACRATTSQDVEALRSWNDGEAKQSILDFVAQVTAEGSPQFVPSDERIATFDNDGTLWVEQPLYSQIQFAIDRVRELAPAHEEWKEAYLHPGQVAPLFPSPRRALLPNPAGRAGGSEVHPLAGPMALRAG